MFVPAAATRIGLSTVAEYLIPSSHMRSRTAFPEASRFSWRCVTPLIDRGHGQQRVRPEVPLLPVAPLMAIGR